MEVYVVVVADREDGLYVFKNAEDAEDFTNAVNEDAETLRAYMTAEPLISHGEVAALIEEETER